MIKNYFHFPDKPDFKVKTFSYAKLQSAEQECFS